MSESHFSNPKKEGKFFSIHFTGRHICPAGHKYEGIRNHFLLHYIEEGSGTVGNSRHEVVKLQKGNCFIFPPQTRIYYKADSKDPWTYRWLAFSMGPRRISVALPGISEPYFIHTNPGDGLLGYLKDIERLFVQSKGLENEKDEEILIQMMSIMIKKLHTPDYGRKEHINRRITYGKPDYVKETRYYIDESFQNQISCQSIADHIGLDRSYLSRIFKEETGMSLKNYLTDIRLKEAIRLLKESDFSISAVAKSTGFKEYKSFARNFKEKYGCSATEI